MRRALLGLAIASALAAGACSSSPRPRESFDLAKYAPFLQSGVTKKAEVFERFGPPESAYEADRVYAWAAYVDPQRGFRVGGQLHGQFPSDFEVVVEFDAADVARRGSLIHAPDTSGWARLR